MPRRCASCGERSHPGAPFCGRCGARRDADAPAEVRRPTRRRSRAARPRPTVSRRALATVGTVVALAAVLAAGLDLEDAPGEVTLPVAAGGDPGPRVLAAPAPPPALAPCDRADADAVCIRWRRPRAHDQPVVADAATVFLAQSGGAVAALERSSGVVRWSTPVTVGEVVDGAVSERTLVLVGSGGRLEGDALAGVDPTDGSLAWTAPAASSEVDVHAGGDAVLVLEPDRLRRLEATTGTERWSWPTADPAGVRVIASTDDATVVSSDRTISALDAGTGLVRWSVGVPRLRGAAVTDPGRLVALDGDGRMLGIATADGEVAWDARLAFDDRSAVRVYGTPGIALAAIDPPRAADGTRTPRLVGVDPATGAVQWVHLYRSPVERRGVELTSEVAVLVGTSRPGAITALDLDSGGIAWQKDLGDDPAHVRVLGEQVLAASGRELVLLAAADGTVLGSARSGSPVIGIVAVDPGSAVLKTSTGLVVVSLPTAG